MARHEPLPSGDPLDLRGAEWLLRDLASGGPSVPQTPPASASVPDAPSHPGASPSYPGAGYPELSRVPAPAPAPEPLRGEQPDWFSLAEPVARPEPAQSEPVQPEPAQPEPARARPEPTVPQFSVPPRGAPFQGGAVPPVTLASTGTDASWGSPAVPAPAPGPATPTAPYALTWGEPAQPSTDLGSEAGLRAAFRRLADPDSFATPPQVAPAEATPATGARLDSPSWPAPAARHAEPPQQPGTPPTGRRSEPSAPAPAAPEPTAPATGWRPEFPASEPVAPAPTPPATGWRSESSSPEPAAAAPTVPVTGRRSKSSAPEPVAPQGSELDPADPFAGFTPPPVARSSFTPLPPEGARTNDYSAELWSALTEPEPVAPAPQTPQRQLPPEPVAPAPTQPQSWSPQPAAPWEPPQQWNQPTAQPRQWDQPAAQPPEPWVPAASEPEQPQREPWESEQSRSRSWNQSPGQQEWQQPRDQSRSWDQPAEQQSWDQSPSWNQPEAQEPRDPSPSWDQPAEQQDWRQFPSQQQPAAQQPWDQPAAQQPWDQSPSWNQAAQQQDWQQFPSQQPVGQQPWYQPAEPHSEDQSPAWDQRPQEQEAGNQPQPWEQQAPTWEPEQPQPWEQQATTWEPEQPQSWAQEQVQQQGWEATEPQAWEQEHPHPAQPWEQPQPQPWVPEQQAQPWEPEQQPQPWEQHHQPEWGQPDVGAQPTQPPHDGGQQWPESPDAWSHDRPDAPPASGFPFLEVRGPSDGHAAAASAAGWALGAVPSESQQGPGSAIPGWDRPAGSQFGGPEPVDDVLAALTAGGPAKAPASETSDWAAALGAAPGLAAPDEPAEQEPLTATGSFDGLSALGFDALTETGGFARTDLVAPDEEPDEPRGLRGWLQRRRERDSELDDEDEYPAEVTEPVYHWGLRPDPGFVDPRAEGAPAVGGTPEVPQFHQPTPRATEPTTAPRFEPTPTARFDLADLAAADSRDGATDGAPLPPDPSDWFSAPTAGGPSSAGAPTAVPRSGSGGSGSGGSRGGGSGPGGSGSGNAGGPRGNRAGSGRTLRLLLWIAGGLVAVLILVGLFILGTRLIGGATEASSSPATSPSESVAPEPTAPQPAGAHAWDTLFGGECLDPFSDPWAEEFTVVDCAQPHAAQLVYRASANADPAAPFPGEDALAGQITATCTTAGVIDQAAAAAVPDLQVQGTYPVTEAQWNSGQRNVYCFVNRAGGEPLTGSLQGPGPSA